MLVGKDKRSSVSFRLNVNNVLDEVYISESRTNISLLIILILEIHYKGTYASNNIVYDGVTAKIKFSSDTEELGISVFVITSSSV
jgi:hypothetical protein